MSQNNKKSVLKNVLHYSIFLLVLGLLVGGILAALNAWTYPIIKERKEKEVRERLEANFTFTSFTSEGLLEKYPLAGNNATLENIYLIGQEEGQYNEVVYEVKAKGYGGDVVSLVGIYGTGTISKLVVIDVSSETPGFGSKAATHDFDVAGRSTDNFVFEVGNKENYIAGSTVTSKAVDAGVTLAVAHYNQYKDELGLAAVETKTFKFESCEQDLTALPDLRYKYVLSYGDDALNVLVDGDYKILTISNEEYLAKKEEIETVIGKRKVSEYIKSASVEGEVTTLEIYTNGFAGRVTSTYTIEGGSVTAVTINDSGESYDQVGVSTDLATHFPPEIIAGQDDIDSISVVSGASVTSGAILRGAKLAKQYISEVLS